MFFHHDTISSTGNNYLITVDEVLGFIKPTNTEDTTLSAFLSNAIGYVSDTFESYINQGLKEQTYTGIYDGTDAHCNKLFTDNYPITSVSAIQYRLSPSNSFTDLVSDIDTEVLNYKTFISLYNTFFPFGYQNIKIIYSAGYSIIPGDLKQIACESVQIIYDTSKFGNNQLGLKSSNDNSGTLGYSKSFDYSGLRKEHKQILDKYKKYEI